jgi:phosphoribosyl-ATP pyrophosphohydrolase
LNDLTFLHTLETVIADRLRNPTKTSYTARLAEQGTLKAAQKLGEESVELVLAAIAENDARLTEEAADLLYHFLLVLRLRGLTLADIVAELERRHSSAQARTRAAAEASPRSKG